MSCCIIQNLEEILSEINLARVKSNQKEIATSNWSSTLSGLTSYSVKQNWIKVMLNGDCVPEIKAVKLFTALNELRKEHGLAELEESVLICKEK